MDVSEALPKTHETVDVAFKPHESTTALLTDVLHAMQAQQTQIGVLTSRLNALQDEHDAMRDCIHAAGLVSSDRIQAQSHRRRFSRVRRDHPIHWQNTLETAVRLKEFAGMLLLRAGLSVAGALCACSKLTRTEIALAMPELLQQLPMILYAAGGQTAPNNSTDSVECLDSCTGEWRDLPSLRVPRSSCAAVSMGGYLYVAGGFNSHASSYIGSLRSVERLDLQTLSWEDQPGMQKGRTRFALVALNGKIYAIGGGDFRLRPRYVGEQPECYTPDNDAAWQYIPQLGQRRIDVVAVTLHGLIYVLGGSTNLTTLETMERFGIGMPAWEIMPPMMHPRREFGAAATLGRIFIAGGRSDSQRFCENVDCFDPATRRWNSIATLRVPRYCPGVIGRAGRMFVVGGRADNGDVCDIDRLDLDTSQWMSLSPLRTGRSLFSLAASYG